MLADGNILFFQLLMRVNGRDMVALNDWDSAGQNRRVAIVSQAVVQSLDVGDVVHVQLHRGRLKGHGGPVYTSFLGMRLGEKKKEKAAVNDI